MCYLKSVFSSFSVGLACTNQYHQICGGPSAARCSQKWQKASSKHQLLQKAHVRVGRESETQNVLPLMCKCLAGHTHTYTHIHTVSEFKAGIWGVVCQW